MKLMPTRNIHIDCLPLHSAEEDGITYIYYVWLCHRWVDKTYRVRNYASQKYNIRTLSLCFYANNNIQRAIIFSSKYAQRISATATGFSRAVMTHTYYIIIVIMGVYGITIALSSPHTRTFPAKQNTFKTSSSMLSALRNNYLWVFA